MLLKKTPLHAVHLSLNAKMVDFAGWDLPIQYQSQKQEHLAVREHCGLFDVSHMSPLDVLGKGSEAFLRFLLANDVAKLDDGTALYSCMCLQNGGVIDDLIVYRLAADHFRVVLNSGTRVSDMRWIEKQISNWPDVQLKPCFDGSILALQGPKSLFILDALSISYPQKRFAVEKSPYGLIARTGYTGEDGVEIMLPGDGATLWATLQEAGAVPCGLGARDTLRLEAGMSLYGQDLDQQHSPLESGVGWSIDWSDEKRDFLGKQAIQAQRTSGEHTKMVGLLLEDRGVLRAHVPVYSDGVLVGETTSGGFSPSSGRSIALARVSTVAACYEVELRAKRFAATRVKFPFVKNAKPTF